MDCMMARHRQLWSTAQDETKLPIRTDRESLKCFPSSFTKFCLPVDECVTLRFGYFLVVFCIVFLIQNPKWPIFTARCRYAHHVLATATWLAGCLSVTRRYCVNTAKPILKLFDHIIALSFYFLLTPVPISIPPSAGALNTQGVGKIGDFRWKSPFVSETVRDRPMVTMER